VTYQRFCASDSSTQDAGEAFAAVLRPGDVVLLSGRLGAGKTTFVKGVARALGVIERVTSPTFVMVRQHDAHNDRGITTLHHADVYRVDHLGDVLDLDLGELVEEDGVAMVEWGDLAASVFGREVLTLDFDVDVDDARRISAAGSIDVERASALKDWAS
jgi:tRNA threonylcarbamoyladenosine biosynthesis protein TsaE